MPIRGSSVTREPFWDSLQDPVSSIIAGCVQTRGCDIDANLLNELRIDRRERDDEGGGVPRWVWVLLAVGVVLGLLGGAAWWFLGARPLPVQTAAAVSPGSGSGGGAGAILQATGYITARRQATVSTQLTGTLTEVLIEEGDRVEKGQVLARLEDGAVRATLNVARANLLAVEAQVAQARTQLTQAGADARRQDELSASGMTTKQAAEQARTALAAASALLEARQREADAARAQVAQAQVNYDYTTVRAPFAGVVTVKAAQVGEIVSPLSAGGGFTRTGVGTIVDMNSLEVDVDVSEAYIGQVKPGMPVEAVLDAYPDWRVPAHVIAIVPSADRGKATVKVRVGFEQHDARMVPDMGVRVSFLNPAAAGAAASAPAVVPRGVLVPPQALARREGGTVVFVVDQGRAQQRSVTPAAQDVGGRKLLPEAVKPGERVVLSPPDTLHDGAAVRPDESN